MTIKTARGDHHFTTQEGADLFTAWLSAEGIDWEVVSCDGVGLF